MIEYFKHVMVIPDLLAASGIFVIWFLDGHFIEPARASGKRRFVGGFNHTHIELKYI